MTRNNPVPKLKIMMLIPFISFLLSSMIFSQTTEMKWSFKDFTAKEKISDDQEIIASDAKLEMNGVKMEVSLIKINMVDSSFHAFVKGKLFPNKVELTMNRDDARRDKIKFTASESGFHSSDKNLLIGNAMVVSGNNWIRADKIVINYK